MMTTKQNDKELKIHYFDYVDTARKQTYAAETATDVLYERSAPTVRHDARVYAPPRSARGLRERENAR